MKQNKRNAFTLIELVAVLVIMAIIALIVTPLVMNIIRKSRISADKRSIDAYGRSIELAIAGYLLDNGKFPTSVDQLTTEYSGNKVECETTQINTDSSVYLAGCTVAGRSVDGYTYGKNSSSDSETTTYKSYKVGDLVEYNHNTYYVIKNSDEAESSVTLLKDVPLMKEDVNKYLISTGVGGTANNRNGYGEMKYGDTSDYATSNIKKVVDAWAQDNTNSSDLLTDSTGYSVRLLSHDELINSLGYVNSLETYKTTASSNGTTPEFVYNSNYSYWTMSTYGDDHVRVWLVENYGAIGITSVFFYAEGSRSLQTVRPVITISKSAL